MVGNCKTKSLCMCNANMYLIMQTKPPLTKKLEMGRGGEERDLAMNEV